MKKIGFVIWIASVLLGMQTAEADQLKRISIGASISYHDIEPGKTGEVDREFRPAPLWGLEAGYQITKAFSLSLQGGFAKNELEVMHDEQSGILGELTRKSVFLTGRYRFRVIDSQCWIYLGVGGGYLENEFENEPRTGTRTFFALNRTLMVEDGYGLMLQAGAAYFPIPEISVSLDIRSIFTKSDITLTTQGADPIENEMSMNTSVFGIGIHYHF